MHPFHLSVGDDALDDLRRRLRTARWPEPAPVTGWDQGVPLDWLQDLCRYWSEEYDWRRLESRLNALPQFTTVIDDLTLHFVHVKSSRADALPLIITHGWPGSVVEFLDVIDALAADFHVVCPSLPGFGFSGKPASPGWNPARIAAAWASLMTSLGYERFGAQGGDWGSAVTTQLALQFPSRVAGIHLNYAPLRSLPDDELTPFEQKNRDDAAEFLEWGSGYALQQGTRPQTLGYGLVDSPVGQCAWIAEKYWAWTDPRFPLTPDQMLDNISVYWHTATAASSARIYWEDGFARPSNRARGRSMPQLSVPVAVSVFPHEIIRPSRRLCERAFPALCFYEQLDRGGHFAAFEQPTLFVDQVRRAFLAMR